ncbi:MAG: ATP-binding cassette domain-containing protein, partial [bacterium]
MEKLLQVINLNIHFDNEVSYVKAVEGVSFDVAPGEVRGIVGESGCGKSVTARAILRILNRRGSIPEGEILYNKQG